MPNEFEKNVSRDPPIRLVKVVSFIEQQSNKDNNLDSSMEFVAMASSQTNLLPGQNKHYLRSTTFNNNTIYTIARSSKEKEPLFSIINHLILNNKICINDNNSILNNEHLYNLIIEHLMNSLEKNLNTPDIKLKQLKQIQILCKSINILNSEIDTSSLILSSMDDSDNILLTFFKILSINLFMLVRDENECYSISSLVSFCDNKDLSNDCPCSYIQTMEILLKNTKPNSLFVLIIDNQFHLVYNYLGHLYEFLSDKICAKKHNYVWKSLNKEDNFIFDSCFNQIIPNDRYMSLCTDDEIGAALKMCRQNIKQLDNQINSNNSKVKKKSCSLQ